jgi:hypothetical protein
MPRTRLTDRIAKTASITERLDVIASELEQVDPRIALAIDQVSDSFESRKALTEEDDSSYTDYSLIKKIREAITKLPGDEFKLVREILEDKIKGLKGGLPIPPRQRAST